MGVSGGKSQGVYVVTDAEIASGRFRLRPGPAVKVAGLQSSTRGVLGGNAVPVYVVTDPTARGVEGGESVPVSNLTGIRSPLNDLAIPVYVTSDDGQFESPAYVGPFDGITFSALYGMKRYLSSYTGPLIRLRRDSDNEEEDFGYVEDTGKVDQAAIDDFLDGANPFLSVWYDQSGNERDVPQSTDTAQPAYIANMVNSLPGVRFDGTSDILYANSLTAFSVTNPGYIQVVNLRVATSNRGIFCGTRAVGNDYQVGWAITQQNANVRFDGPNLALDPAIGNATWGIVSYYVDSATLTGRLNGANPVTSAGESLTDITQIVIGSRVPATTFYSAVDLTTVMIVDNMSDADHNTIGNELATLYGLSWSTVS